MKKFTYLGLFFILITFLLIFYSPKVSCQAALASNIEITGLSVKAAKEKLGEFIALEKENINIKLVYENQNFYIKGNDLNVVNLDDLVKATFKNNTGKNIFEKMNIFRRLSQKINVRVYDLFSGYEKIMQDIKTKVEREMQEPNLNFFPDKKIMFTVNEGKTGVKVDTEELKARLIYSMEENLQSEIAVPVILTPPTKNKEEVLKSIVKRSEFSTGYKSSVGGRKYNVLLALSAFNGFIVKPNQTISFNKVINDKIPFSNFKIAKIIVNGEFVDGRGGGICQASTTLYNALLLADLTVLESHSHSLPVGYVKLGFDAMVNPGGADLVFKNTTDKPIYIKTYGNDEDCFVEIYGESLPKGLTIKRKSEFIRAIKHSGDKIIPDSRGKFTDKILFRGEFYRIKYPQEGCEANSYLQYVLDGELVEERFIRFSKYNAQSGIVYEGTESLPEGLTEPVYLPIKTISPQEETNTDEANVESKINEYNPTHFSQ